MNRLNVADRAKILRLLVEGNSLRSCSRITNIHIDTITRVLVQVGKACQEFHNQTAVNVKSQRIQCDEVWSFVYAKRANVPFSTRNDEQQMGDAWTWVAVDADSRMVISWLVSDRSRQAANTFMADVAYRIKNKVQITTDGFKNYREAIRQAFKNKDYNYGQIFKVYGNAKYRIEESERIYSPAKIVGFERKVVYGNPDEDHISTSYVERQNLTMRMHMRRFTRLTNGFSKKIENHCYAIALHYFYYNFVKVHSTLRVTPAMAAKLAVKPMTLEDIVMYAYKDEIEQEQQRLKRMYR